MIRLLLAVALLTLCGESLPADFSYVNPETVGFSTDRLEKLRDYIRGYVSSGDVPGASFLLLRHGKIVMFDCSGMADVQRRIPMKRDTIVRIYSQTKLVTGVALLMLFEEGKWSLNDPITKFVPELGRMRVVKRVAADGSMELEDLVRPATMRELLSHSAGFAYGLNESNPIEAAYAKANFMAAASQTEAIERIANLPLAYQPGTHWLYSAAVDIQGYIIERISGQPLADYMEQRIFGPLSMVDTGFYVPAEKLSRFAGLSSYDRVTGHLTAPSGVLMFDYTKPPAVSSGGAGLVSTARDYARFEQALLNGGQLDGVRLLSPAAVQLLGSNQLSEAVRRVPGGPYGVESGIGHGINIDLIEDPARAGTLVGAGTMMGGGAAGTWYWIDRANDIVFIGLLQVMNRWDSPRLVNIDRDSRVLVNAALVRPGS